MKKFLLFIVLFSYGLLYSQVGINTTSPSPASVLDVNSSNGTSFGGFMPPRVTPSERDLISATSTDEGLMVYVINPPNSQLQIWDGTAWQTMFPQIIEISTVLAAWEVSGLTNFGPSPFGVTSNNIGITVGGLTRGSGLTTTGATIADNAWGANGWFASAPTETQASAIANNKLVTFSITPNIGVNLSISSIEPYNIRRSGTGPTTGIWQYSINGGAFVDIGTEITWGGTTTVAGNDQVAIDLSGIADLQNLTSANVVTFRIVNWGATAGGGTWYINNIAGYDLIIRGNLTR